MIRFVDIRRQGTGFRFAWWNTSADTFLSFGDRQAWDTWEDFVEAYKDYYPYPLANISRYRKLCPAWVFEPYTEAEQAYDFEHTGG